MRPQASVEHIAQISYKLVTWTYTLAPWKPIEVFLFKAENLIDLMLPVTHTSLSMDGRHIKVLNLPGCPGKPRHPTLCWLAVMSPWRHGVSKQVEMTKDRLRPSRSSWPMAALDRLPPWPMRCLPRFYGEAAISLFGGAGLRVHTLQGLQQAISRLSTKVH